MYTYSLHIVEFRVKQGGTSLSTTPLSTRSPGGKVHVVWKHRWLFITIYCLKKSRTYFSLRYK